MTQVYPRVVDLSHHNTDDGSEIDWQAVKRDGIWGVIYKATESTDYIDPTYDEARRQAKAVGLLWGAYHFFRPGSVAAQVEHFLLHAMPGPDTLLVLDHEDEGCSIDSVKTFLRMVEEKTGQRPALYSGHVLKEQLGNRIDSYLGDTRLWLAQYGSELEVPATWPEGAWLWQFTDGQAGPSPHAIDGIGRCDINSFDGTQQQLTATWAEASVAPPQPQPPEPPTPPPDGVPSWLAVMRGLTGLTEVPGSGDNPRIMHMADTIGRKYPEQADYAALYTGDDIAWCGLTVGYCMTMCNIEPIFGPTDTDRWMWAQAWADFGVPLAKPKQGCVVVQTRDGGGHVTLFERWEGSNLICRGGNQSDMVKESSYSPSVVIAYRWPSENSGSTVPSVVMGDNEMAWTQASLNLIDNAGLDLDGEYGPLTREALTDYQRKNDLPATGTANKETVDELISELMAWNNGRPGE
jgi:lysozyme